MYSTVEYESNVDSINQLLALNQHVKSLDSVRKFLDSNREALLSTPGLEGFAEELHDAHSISYIQTENKTVTEYFASSVKTEVGLPSRNLGEMMIESIAQIYAKKIGLMQAHPLIEGALRGSLQSEIPSVAEKTARAVIYTFIQLESTFLIRDAKRGKEYYDHQLREPRELFDHIKWKATAQLSKKADLLRTGPQQKLVNFETNETIDIPFAPDTTLRNMILEYQAATKDLERLVDSHKALPSDLFDKLEGIFLKSMAMAKESSRDMTSLIFKSVTSLPSKL